MGQLAALVPEKPSKDMLFEKVASLCSRGDSPIGKKPGRIGTFGVSYTGSTHPLGG